MVCDLLTRKPRLSTICSWNFSSQWAVRKHGELSLVFLLTSDQTLKVKHFDKRATTWTYAWRTLHWWSWHHLGSGHPWWSQLACHQLTWTPTRWWNSQHFSCPGSLSWSGRSCSASCCFSQTRRRRRRNSARTGGCWSSRSCCVSLRHSARKSVRRWCGSTFGLSNGIRECQRVGIAELTSLSSSDRPVCRCSSFSLSALRTVLTWDAVLALPPRATIPREEATTTGEITMFSISFSFAIWW